MIALHLHTVTYEPPVAGTGTDEAQAATTETLEAAGVPSSSAASAVATWKPLEGNEGVAIHQQHQVSYVTWHSRGDYFASVAPTGNNCLHLEVCNTDGVAEAQVSSRCVTTPARFNPLILPVYPEC